MTKATARTIDALASRAFPILLRLFAVAGAFTFAVAVVSLISSLAALYVGSAQ